MLLSFCGSLRSRTGTPGRDDRVCMTLLRRERDSNRRSLSSESARARLAGGGGSQERTRLWEAQNSLLAGKIQGISSTLASVARICRQNGDYNQSFTSKFPARRNRELIGPYQGIKSVYQGNFLPDQGREPSNTIGSRLLKLPFQDSRLRFPSARPPQGAQVPSVSPPFGSDTYLDAP